MKQDFKNKIILTVACFSVIAVLSPFFGFAQTNNSLKTRNEIKQTICTRISDFAQKTEKKLTEKEKVFLDKKSAIEKNIQERWTNRDTKLDAFRKERLAIRQEHYQKLTEKGKDEAQKQAVAAFQSTVEQAVTTRQAAVDAAKKKFRDGVDLLIQQRKSSVDSLIGTLKASAVTALEKAKTSCLSSSVDVSATRTTLIGELKAAREKFVTDRKAVDKISNDLRALKDTRNQEIKKAMDNFQTAVEKAKADLKKAFGEKPANGTPDTSAPATTGQ